MTHRELPPEEWHRLAGTDLSYVGHPTMVPTHVLVVEDEHGQIVAHWSLMHLWHAEGLRIMESHAKSPSVGRHLLVGLRELAADRNASVVWTGAAEDDTLVREMLLQVGAMPIPQQPFLWPILRTTGLR